MTIIKQVSLYYQSGSSDKQYDVQLIREDLGFVVNFAYGRRGTALKAGTKTRLPIGQMAAKAIYDKLVKEKMAEDYRPGDLNGAMVAPPSVETGEFSSQLLNPIKENEVEFYLSSPGWGMQEKHDGQNRILGHTAGMSPFGLNRKGEVVALAAELDKAMATLGCKSGRVVMPSEDMGGYAWVHDLIFCGQDCSHLAYQDRYVILKGIANDFPEALKLSPLWTDVQQKQERYEFLKDNGAEGVVFKRLGAPYTPGRPASGGDMLKDKFWKSATFIVAKINQKNSVGMSLLDADGEVVKMGNVTVPPNYTMPAVGALIEVKYLYRLEGGKIYQPVYKGVRTDIEISDCTMNQLAKKTHR